MLYTATEVATLLRLNVETVYRWIHKGKIAGHRVGKTYRIPQSEISKLLKPIHATHQERKGNRQRVQKYTQAILNKFFNPSGRQGSQLHRHGE
jgi:excisionase family DNA binding protein